MRIFLYKKYSSCILCQKKKILKNFYEKLCYVFYIIFTFMFLSYFSLHFIIFLVIVNMYLFGYKRSLSMHSNVHLYLHLYTHACIYAHAFAKLFRCNVLTLLQHKISLLACSTGFNVVEVFVDLFYVFLLTFYTLHRLR